MKTTSEIYEQQKRINNLLLHNTQQRIKEVHPDTGGNIHLTHNWGNLAAQNYLNIYRDRQCKLYYLFEKYYHNAFCAQYPNHLANKNKYI